MLLLPLRQPYGGYLISRIADSVDKESDENTKYKYIESYEFNILEGEMFQGNASNEEMVDYAISFEGSIENFEGFRLGKGINEHSGMALELYEDRILVKNEHNETIDERMIGIELQETIGVVLYADSANHAFLSIKSNDANEQIEITWNSRNGKVAIQGIGTTRIKNGLSSKTSA